MAATYHAEIDGYDADTWSQTMAEFDDANIYQTWSYGIVRQGLGRVSHLALKRAGALVAAAQIRLFPLPVVGGGMAYVQWGPLWRRSGTPADVEVFRQVIRALRNEYVDRRRMVLRLLPWSVDHTGELAGVLHQEGFTLSQRRGNRRTLIMDLTRTEDELRAGMRSRWRSYLNKAEKDGLSVVEGDSLELFEQSMQMYEKLRNRKGFEDGVDVQEYTRLQAALPGNAKMRVLLCRAAGQACAAVIASAIGRIGIYLFGASNEVGMRNRGAYLLQWRTVQWLKERGCIAYDLNGINPVANPGVYQFKTGLCGKDNGTDVTFLASHDCYARSPSTIAVLTAARARERWRELRSRSPRSDESKTDDSSVGGRFDPAAVPSLTSRH